MRLDRQTRRRVLIVGIAASAVAVVGVSVPASAAQGAILHANEANSIAGSYIVKFTPSFTPNLVAGKSTELAAAFGGKVRHTFTAIGGFSVTMSETQAKRLAADPAVEYVEQNAVIEGFDEQPNPVWGLDRIDQRDLPVNNKYVYPSSAGAGVTAYIVDTGINATHSEFSGRVKPGKDFHDNDNDPTDCNGHGTHVAGTIGGSTYGVAKKVNLVSMRVLGCDSRGQLDNAVKALDFITSSGAKPAVANLSLGGGKYQAMNDGVERAVRNGLTVVVAAGNNGGDACQTSPASAPSAITVAASDSADRRSIWNGQSVSSNWGGCVDIFAPGSGIKSAYYDSNTSTRDMNGTSMASPHVAGAAALYLGVSGNGGKTPAEVTKALIDNSTPNKISDVMGSPNKLLHTGFMNGPEGPACQPVSSTEDKAIPDAGAAVSTSATVSNCSGGGSGATKVKVDIVHSYSADLKVELVSPSGKIFLLQAPRGVGSANGIHQEFSVDTSSESAKNGAWKLQVTDTIAYDTGNIDGWTLTF
ncbi:MAG: S8 family peptidase [Actinomycetota bacterium]|nr:S8 family peptidase [Actinomycetota bacterium]